MGFNSAFKGLTFNNCTLCPHCIYVFCIYLRRNSDLCHLQHKLFGFYNRVEECLLRGTNWVFKYSSRRRFYNRDEKFLRRGTNWVFKYSSLRLVFKATRRKITGPARAMYNAWVSADLLPWSRSCCHHRSGACFPPLQHRFERYVILFRLLFNNQSFQSWIGPLA